MQTKREMTISESLECSWNGKWLWIFWGKNTGAICFLGNVLWSNLKALKYFPYFLITQIQNWLWLSAFSQIHATGALHVFQGEASPWKEVPGFRRRILLQQDTREWLVLNKYLLSDQKNDGKHKSQGMLERFCVQFLMVTPERWRGKKSSIWGPPERDQFKQLPSKPKKEIW